MGWYASHHAFELKLQDIKKIQYHFVQDILAIFFNDSIQKKTNFHFTKIRRMVIHQKSQTSGIPNLYPIPKEKKKIKKNTFLSHKRKDALSEKKMKIKLWKKKKNYKVLVIPRPFYSGGLAVARP